MYQMMRLSVIFPNKIRIWNLVECKLPGRHIKIDSPSWDKRNSCCFKLTSPKSINTPMEHHTPGCLMWANCIVLIFGFHNELLTHYCSRWVIWAELQDTAGCYCCRYTSWFLPGWIRRVKCSFVLSKEMRQVSNPSQQNHRWENPLLWMMTGMDHEGDINISDAGMVFTVDTFK